MEADKGKSGMFLQQYVVKFISYGKEKNGGNYITNLKVAEQKLLQLRAIQKCTRKLLKEAKEV